MRAEPWLSVEKIADHLDVSNETIYRWLERESIPAHRAGKQSSEVDKWVMSGNSSKGTSKNTLRSAEILFRHSRKDGGK